MVMKLCPRCGKSSLDHDPERRVWRCLYAAQCGYASDPEPTPEQRIRELEEALGVCKHNHQLFVETWGPTTERLEDERDNLMERLNEVLLEREAAKAEARRYKRGLDAIIIRCDDGDPKVDWLPTIKLIAEAALAPAEGEEDRDG